MPVVFSGRWPGCSPESQVRWPPATSSAMSAPELPGPTTRTPPSRSCDGLRYSLECSCTMRGSSSGAKAGIRAAGRRPEASDDLVGLEAPLARREHEAPARRPEPVDAHAPADREPEVRRVGLEVVGHLVPRGEGPGRGGERHPGQAVVAGGREQAQGVPAPAPRVADALVGVQDHERPAAPRQVVPDGEARLARRRRSPSRRARPRAPRPPAAPARCSTRPSPPPRRLRVCMDAIATRAPRPASSGEAPNRRRPAAWVISPIRRGRARTRTRSRRRGRTTPSLAKMLLTWRSTVRSLSTSSAAIALFVSPAATRRRTWSSRAVSPWASPARGRRRSCSTRAASGAAPTSANSAPAASSSSAPPSLRRPGPGRRARAGRARARPRTARRGRSRWSRPGAARAAPRPRRPPRARRSRARGPTPRTGRRSSSRRASVPSSSRARRASSRSPAASMISTPAGSSPARVARSVVSPSTRRMPAAAPPDDRPGPGAAAPGPAAARARPDTARRYASSAASSSPRRRRSSPWRAAAAAAAAGGCRTPRSAPRPGAPPPGPPTTRRGAA